MLRHLTKKMAESAAKRLKTDGSPSVTIGTHNGHFHADEALAVYMLRQLPRYENSSLVRTRDPSLLSACDTVVDVGGVYDPSADRYDHHQRTFATTFPGRPTKLSSAGLVYLHFGRSLVAQRLAQEEESPDVDLLFPKIYESFIEALDAHDNGISAYNPQGIASAGLSKSFSDGGFTLGAMVGRLNPNWNDPTPADPAEAQAEEDARFEEASRRIGEEFSRDLDYYAKAWLPARTIVRAAYTWRQKHDPHGRIMVLEGQAVPWKDHLYALEAEEGNQRGEEVLYVLYPEKPAPGAKWRIQAVPVTKDSFESRKALPEPWRGARDDQLDDVCGVSGGVFVHASGFIGGNKTFDGAKAMAEKACAF